MRKTNLLKKCVFILVLTSFCINVFNIPIFAIDISINEQEKELMYNGTIEDLPKQIYESYLNNSKATSIDVYDTDLFSLTMNNSDGTKTIEIFQNPIKFIENNEIKFIDPSIKKSSLINRISSTTEFESVGTPVKSYFSTNLINGISVEKDRYSIRCSTYLNESSTILKRIEKPSLSNNELTYDNVFSNYDKIIYTPVSTGVKEEIVLEKCPESNVFIFKLELNNLIPETLTGDSISLLDT